MAVGGRLEQLVVEAGFGPNEIARVTNRAPTTVSAWFREKNRLSRANKGHIKFVKDVLAFIRADDKEEWVWVGQFGHPEPSESKPAQKSGATVERLLLDFLEGEGVPNKERKKARIALEALLGLL